MNVTELMAELDRQPGVDFEAKLLALLRRWTENNDPARLQLEITQLRESNDRLERTVLELQGKVEPAPVGDTFTIEQFMVRLASKLGRTYGWRTDYALASRNTPGCQVVSTDDIQRWQREKKVPAWAFQQIDQLNFKPRVGRSATDWSNEEVQYLIDLYNSDPSQSNATLAAQCSAQFGREITPDAIKGALYRLGQQGKLPQQRQSKRRT